MQDVQVETAPRDDLTAAPLIVPQTTRYERGLSELKSAYAQLRELKAENDLLRAPNNFSQPMSLPELDTKLSNACGTALVLDQLSSAMTSMFAEKAGRDANGNLRMFGAIEHFIESYDNRSTQLGRRPPISKELLLFERVIAQGLAEKEGPRTEMVGFFGIIEPRAVKGFFPDALGYLDLPKSLRTPGLTLRRKLDGFNELLLNADGINDEKLGKGSSRVSKEDTIQQKIAAVKAQIHQLVQDATDITLIDFADLIDSVAITFAPSQELLNQICYSATTIIEALMQLTDDQRGSKREVCRITVLKFPNVGSPLRVETDEVKFVIPTETGQVSECIAHLADYYLALRKILFAAHLTFLNETPRDPSLSGIKTEIKDRLGSLFGGRDNGRISAAIFEMSSPKAEKMKTELMATQVVKMSESDVRYAFQDPHQMPLYRYFIRHLLSVPTEAYERAKDLVKESPIHKQLETVLTIRYFLDHSKRVELVNLLHRELDRERGSNEKHFAAAGLLFALELLAEYPNMPKLLRGWLPNPGRIRNLEGITLSVTNDKPALDVCKTATMKVMRSFDATLDDYIGAPQVVRDICELIEGNRTILENPERLAGNHPKLAVINAILLVSAPGAGKTFLFRCLANHFGYVLEQISLEQMYADYESRQRTSKKQWQRSNDKESSEQVMKPVELLSQHIADFLKKKVHELRHKIKEKGLNGGIIFIDEMEAEFLKRNPEFADVSAVERTNMTLRAIEKEIEAHPDIIFGGATNHIGMVDSAALRVGRFTVKFFLPLVSRESAKMLVDDMLIRFRLDCDKLALLPEHEELMEGLVDTIPQFVQMVVVRTCALHDNLDPRTLNYQEFARKLIDQFRFLKRITSNEPPPVKEGVALESH